MAAHRLTPMQDVDLKRLRLTITVGLSVAGKSARAVSIAAGMGPDTLGKFLKGDTQSLRADNMARVLQVLNIPLDSIVSGEGAPQETAARNIAFGVRFGGVVEAGAFRREDGLNQDAERRLIPLPTDPRYPAASQFAFAVVGDSMTEARIYEGMYVLGLDVHAWERIHGEPGDGKLVVVARHRNGDDERELTVKRLRLFRDRMELQPESKNPRHEAIVFPLPHRQDLGQDEEAEARIIAVVLSATWILT